MDLLPGLPLLAVGRVADFGCKKHGSSDGWRDVVGAESAQEHIAAAIRHIYRDTWEAEADTDSGEPHLAHAVMRLLMAMQVRKEVRER